MPAIQAPGFTAWDHVASRTTYERIPDAGSYGGADAHRWGRNIAQMGRGPLQAPSGRLTGMGAFESGIPFFSPLAVDGTPYGGGEVIIPTVPPVGGEPTVEQGSMQYTGAEPHGFEVSGLGAYVSDVPGPAAAPGEPLLGGLGFVYMGHDPRASGALAGLGQLPFGLDTQSLMWVAILGAGVFILPRLLGGGKKARGRALRKATAQHKAKQAAIRAEYA